MHGSTAGRRGAGVVSVDAGGGELGVVAVVADGVPASSFLADEGVEAVLGDDVEAVVALHDEVMPRASTTSAPTRRASGGRFGRSSEPGEIPLTGLASSADGELINPGGSSRTGGRR